MPSKVPTVWGNLYHPPSWKVLSDGVQLLAGCRSKERDMSGWTTVSPWMHGGWTLQSSPAGSEVCRWHHLHDCWVEAEAAGNWNLCSWSKMHQAMLPYRELHLHPRRPSLCGWRQVHHSGRSAKEASGFRDLPCWAEMPETVSAIWRLYHHPSFQGLCSRGQMHSDQDDWDLPGWAEVPKAVLTNWRMQNNPS